jgi:hypothetical protein
MSDWWLVIGSTFSWGVAGAGLPAPEYGPFYSQYACEATLARVLTLAELDNAKQQFEGEVVIPDFEFGGWHVERARCEARAPAAISQR